LINKKRQNSNQPSWDPDDLYQDFCTGNGTLEFVLNQGYPNSCNPVGNEITTYLNRLDVQNAIGAKHIEWNGCSNINYTTLGNSMIPIYEKIFTTDLKVLVYSGDVDIATVPFGITQACLAELPGQPVQSWQPWFINGATAGYVEEYPSYTYATLKGAGHESPAYVPVSAYEMISRFINYQTLLTSKPANVQKLLSQGQALRNYGVVKY